MIDRSRRMNSRRESPDGNTGAGIEAVTNRRRVKPASAAGVKQPSTVMIGRPAPRVEAIPSPAESGIQNPLTVRKRRPAVANAERPPAEAVSAAVGPGTVRVKASETRRVVGRTGVLHGGRIRGGNRVDLSGDPAVEFILSRNAADAHGGRIAGLHRERLAFFEGRGFVLVKHGDAAGEIFHGAAIVKIIETESGTASGLDREVAAGNAEIIAAHRIYMERSAALPQNQARDQSAVLQGKIIKLKDRVFLQESQRAVFELDFRAAVVRGQHVALPNGKV